MSETPSSEPPTPETLPLWNPDTEASAHFAARDALRQIQLAPTHRCEPELVQAARVHADSLADDQCLHGITAAIAVA